MIKLLPLEMILTSLTFLLILGYIAFRLLWLAPLAAKRRFLPERWQRWLLDEPSGKRQG